MKNKFKSMFAVREPELNKHSSMFYIVVPLATWIAALLISSTIPDLLKVPILNTPSDQFSSNNFRMVATIVGAIVTLIVPVYLSQGVLKREWRQFRVHLGRNILIAFGLFLLLEIFGQFIVLPILQQMPTFSSALSTNSIINMTIVPLVTLLAPFSEELTFHYLLTDSLQTSKAKIIFSLIFANLAFALIHVYAASFAVPMLIFYFFMGLVFHFIHLYFKNIWFNIFAHFFYNLMGVLVSLSTAFILIFTR